MDQVSLAFSVDSPIMGIGVQFKQVIMKTPQGLEHQYMAFPQENQKSSFVIHIDRVKGGWQVLGDKGVRLDNEIFEKMSDKNLSHYKHRLQVGNMIFSLKYRIAPEDESTYIRDRNARLAEAGLAIENPQGLIIPKEYTKSNDDLPDLCLSRVYSQSSAIMRRRTAPCSLHIL